MPSRYRETSIELDVPFHDVDAGRRVWHGHYYRYFELARTALLRASDLDIGDSSPLGTGAGGKGYEFVVIESRCRHAAPLRYGDRFRVSAWFRDHERRVMIGYEIWNLTTETRSARGHTALVTLDATGGLLQKTPDEILKRIRS